jgi:peptidoglycan/xylan/chitin deacetylase (PgdA/CDA1 family)
MLLILMYHRVHGRGLTPNALRSHLDYIRDHHPVVLPGDALPRNELSVCLTFDDATVDFYHELYPLLHELDLRALVAIPTAFVSPATALPMQTRLAAQDRTAMSGEYSSDGCPLCSWEELREMQASGRVHCASHSHSHANMAAPDTDVEGELLKSSRVMTESLGEAPVSFVYPYGATNRGVQAQVKRHFRYAMRIGTAMNRGWEDNGGLLYRVDAEAFWPRGKVWSVGDAVRYRLKYLGNRVRGK